MIISELTNSFIKDYEIYKASIENEEYGEIYKVEIMLNEEGLTSEVMSRLENSFDAESKNAFFKQDEANAVIIIEISHVDEGVHEIEITMDKTLQGGKYGSYKWACLKV